MKAYIVVRDEGSEGLDHPIGVFTDKIAAEKMMAICNDGGGIPAIIIEMELDEFTDAVNAGYLPYEQFESSRGLETSVAYYPFRFTTTPFSKKVDVTEWYDRKKGLKTYKTWWCVWAKKGDAERVFANYRNTDRE